MTCVFFKCKNHCDIKATVKYKLGELFCGPGGIALGAEMATEALFCLAFWILKLMRELAFYSRCVPSFIPSLNIEKRE